MQNDMLQENVHLLTVQFQPITGSGVRLSYINVCIGQIHCTRQKDYFTAVSTTPYTNYCYYYQHIRGSTCEMGPLRIDIQFTV